MSILKILNKIYKNIMKKGDTKVLNMSVLSEKMTGGKENIRHDNIPILYIKQIQDILDYIDNVCDLQKSQKIN